MYLGREKGDVIPTQGPMHVKLQKSEIQDYTNHLPPSSLLPTLTTAASSPVRRDSTVDSNLVPRELFAPKPSAKHDYSPLLLVPPRFHLARIERGWPDSPKPEISSLPFLCSSPLTHTIPHRTQGGSDSDQKIIGTR